MTKQEILRTLETAESQISELSEELDEAREDSLHQDEIISGLHREIEELREQLERYEASDMAVAVHSFLYERGLVSTHWKASETDWRRALVSLMRPFAA